MQTEFMPVTTFGEKYPLDNLIRPFLPRVAETMMVSYHYARQIRTARLPLPCFVDSGGFAVLFAGARIVERADGTAQIEREGENGETDIVAPEAVLELQRRLARYGCPLDFPIPPMLVDPVERARRLRLTLANAEWASRQDVGALTLFGAVQGWDEESYGGCAQSLLDLGYRHLALGGMVPRVSDMNFVCRIVRQVRERMEAGGRLHVFGIGKPELIRMVLAAGATSTDSSSYVKAAASGMRWDGISLPDDPTPLERAHAAIANIAKCRAAAHEFRTACT